MKLPSSNIMPLPFTSPEVDISETVLKTVQEGGSKDAKKIETGHLEMGSVTEVQVTSPCNLEGTSEVDVLGREKMDTTEKGRLHEGEIEVTEPKEPETAKTKSVVKDNPDSPLPQAKRGRKPNIISTDQVDRKAHQVHKRSQSLPPPKTRQDTTQVGPQHTLQDPPQTPLTPPQTQLNVAQQPAPVDPMKEIRDLASGAATSKEPSQKILGDMMEKLIKQGYDIKELTSELARDSNKSFEVEPFQVPASDRTFYRVKVTYTVEAEKPGTNPLEKETLSFSRTISTSATNPEDAILIAREFKETVRGIALKNAGLSSPQFDNMDKEFGDAAKTSKSFTFDFAKNAAGGLTHLKSISVSKGKDGKNSATYAPKLDTEPRYVVNLKDGKYEKIQSDGEEIKPGERFFSSKGQKDIHKHGVVVKKDYDELMKQQDALAQHSAMLQQEILKKQEEFAKIKAEFIKEPSYSLLNKILRRKAEPSTTDKFLEFKANAHAFHNLKKLGPNDEINPALLTGVTSNKILEYAQLKQDIKQARKDLKDANEGIQQFEKWDEPTFEVIIDAWNDEDIQSFMREVKKHTGMKSDDSRINGKEIKEIISICLSLIKKKKQDANAAIATETDELQTLEQEIGKSQGSFHEQLKQMNQLNRDLDFKVIQLKDLRKKAKAVIKDPLETDPDKKAEAQKVVDQISKETIRAFKAQFEKHQRVIDDILDIFGEFDNDAWTAQED